MQLTKDQVAANASTYLRQLGQDQPKQTALLDFETPGRLEVHTARVAGGMDLPAVIGLLGTGTVARCWPRTTSKRYSSGTAIALHEFLYPLLQGYDSVAVNADVELGAPIKFNVAMGRDLQRHFDKAPVRPVAADPGGPGRCRR